MSKTVKKIVELNKPNSQITDTMYGTWGTETELLYPTHLANMVPDVQSCCILPLGNHGTWGTETELLFPTPLATLVPEVQSSCTLPL